METIILNSCAKINLGLNILRKRDDGYHDLETIFYPVKLCDTISFRKSNTFRFTSNNKELQNNPGNLVIRAKEKIEKITRQEIKAEIHLSKYIPLGGGLGGGSSNAAVTLNGLNMLYNFNLDKTILGQAALELGSDVPFFLNFTPCFATSRGEVMENIDLKIDYPILIINPGIHISTAWAFQNIKPKVPEVNLKSIIKDLPVSRYKDFIFNDFEELVSNENPEIKHLKNSLYEHGALFALLSGSGSTVFGIFETFEDAKRVQSLINNNYLSFIHNENT